MKEPISALIIDLWNQLTRQQKRSAPFRLTRLAVATTRDGLAALALMRRQELDDFIHGLFGREEAVDLPVRLDNLGQMHAQFAAVVQVATDDNKTAPDTAMETAHRHMREMTKNAEHEMHAIVLSCHCT